MPQLGPHDPEQQKRNLDFLRGNGVCSVKNRATARYQEQKMGDNRDSASASSPEIETQAPEKGVFRFRVVEHLSWDAYEENGKSFPLGHKNNKPIAGKKFKIKMPDGSIIEETTDDDGVIELTGQEPTAKYEVFFEPENARMNNYYYLFYNACPPLKKEL
jgi:hypothetical protein